MFRIVIIVFIFLIGCSSKKKIDFKQYPNYPYIIEKVK